MSFNLLAILALSAFVGQVSAKKDEFPLVWVCLGITVVGIIIALYVAYRRPDELHLPGMMDLPRKGHESSNGNYQPQQMENERV
ncbi:unnamed protein product [Phytomonas sp. Hart1]|nr:unnamed protein product [Phytomonas sp. Hart1]|eukprot:CCW71597.1 unnamed protein product [Phytomonas sp. isolate Hart1]